MKSAARQVQIYPQLWPSIVKFSAAFILARYGQKEQQLDCHVPSPVELL